MWPTTQLASCPCAPVGCIKEGCGGACMLVTGVMGCCGCDCRCCADASAGVLPCVPAEAGAGLVVPCTYGSAPHTAEEQGWALTRAPVVWRHKPLDTPVPPALTRSCRSSSIVLTACQSHTHTTRARAQASTKADRHSQAWQHALLPSVSLSIPPLICTRSMLWQRA